MQSIFENKVVLYTSFTMRHGKIYRRMAGGPKQRINLLRHLVTTLVKFERLEAPYGKAHETQKYAERVKHFYIFL